MPALNKPAVSSREKIFSSSSPKQRGAKYKSDEIVKDSDDEGDVLPPRNGKQESESKRKPKESSIGSLTAKTSIAISSGTPTRKRKRDTTSAAVVDSSDIQIHKKVAENVKSAQVENSSGSESGSGNEDGAEGSNNELSKKKGVTTKKGNKKRKAAESAPRYEPPSGFDPATITVAPKSSFAELFSAAGLRNKQIWHIAVPSSVRIDSLRAFSTTSVQTGDTVLSYKGADYGLVLQSKTRNSKKALLLPSAETNEYRPVEVEIARALQLQQLPPKGSNGLNSTTNAALPNRRRYEKPPPQQPDGLRMRYHPFGVTEYSSDESQPEKQTHVPKFRRPLGMETSPPAQMQNGESIDVEMHDAPEQPRSKHKKKLNAVDVQTHNGPSESAPPKHHNKKRDTIDRETPGIGRKRTGDISDAEMTQSSPQPFSPPFMPDRPNREIAEVGMDSVVSEPPSTQKLKHKKKRHANSELEIDAPAAIGSEMNVRLSGTERKRKKNQHTKPEPFQPAGEPAGEQRKNYASTTKEDQDLYSTPSGTIDLAKLSNGEKKHDKKHKKKRHAEADASPAPEEDTLL